MTNPWWRYPGALPNPLLGNMATLNRYTYEVAEGRSVSVTIQQAHVRNAEDPLNVFKGKPIAEMRTWFRCCGVSSDNRYATYIYGRDLFVRNGGAKYLTRIWGYSVKTVIDMQNDVSAFTWYPAEHIVKDTQKRCELRGASPLELFEFADDARIPQYDELFRAVYLN